MAVGDGRRVRVRRNNSESRSPGTRNPAKSRGPSKAARRAKEEAGDPYWEAQHSEEGRNSAPGSIEVTIPLDYSTQFRVEGNDTIIASGVGYTVRFILHEDPFMLRKLMEAADGLNVVNRILERVAKVNAKAKKTATETPLDQSLPAKKRIVGQTGIPTAAQARRALNRGRRN